MTVSVVIGAGYGDEGKGLVTDWLCDSKTLNVRYNGGSQAGHTVINPDGHPFIFSHFGAGTFKGASTFLSSDFIVNPIFFNREYDKLNNGSRKLRVYVDPKCRITTPYDMMINADLESSRSERHGSCGLGIFETINRDKNSRSFRVQDLFYPKRRNDIEVLIRNIRNERVDMRLVELGIPEPKYFHDEGLLQRYIDDIKLMKSRIVPMSWSDLSQWNGNIVFEGAQGLMLCETNWKDFPHLTPSTTGLGNVLPMISQRGTKVAEIYYVSRTYITRHGNGPMPHEHGPPYPDLHDNTNISNKHQGTLRMSTLDLDVLSEAVKCDFAQSRDRDIRFVKNMVLTWCDKPVNRQIRYMKKGFDCEEHLSAFQRILKKEMTLDKVYTSFGPSASHIKE